MSNLKGKRTRKTPTEEGYLIRIKELEVGYVKLCKTLKAVEDERKNLVKECLRLSNLLINATELVNTLKAERELNHSTGIGVHIEKKYGVSDAVARPITPHRKQTEW